MSGRKKKALSENMIVLKMASYKTPEARQIMGRDWVYWGKKNDYFNFLLNLFYNSSKHNAIVNGKTKYIAGGGWGDNGKVAVNSDGETLNNITWKTTFDSEIYGGEAFEVIWTNGGKFAEYRHIDFSKIRTNKDETEYYYTKDWLDRFGNPIQYPDKNEDWQVYKPFDPNNRQEPQILYYKAYCPGLDIYPMPEYQASLLYIDLEYQIANYWSNRVRNGFMPSAILNFYMANTVTEDEMRKLEEKIKAKFTSTDNAGQFIMNFAANKDSAADIQQITPPELGAEYEALNLTLQKEIMTGHGVTSPELFGIMQPSTLGRSQLIEQNELFQNRYVNPKQQSKEEFYEQYIFPYIKGVKGEAELTKQEPIGYMFSESALIKYLPKRALSEQEPIGYMFSESALIKYLPKRALSEMIAKKMGVDLKQYPEFEKEQEDNVEAENGQQFKKTSKEKEDKLLAKLRSKGKKRNIAEVLYSRPVTFEMSKDLKASEEEIRMTFAAKKIPVIIGGGGSSPINIDVTKPTERISVVYTYEWVEGFSDANLGTSREFCVEMRTDSKSGITWTREDIETLDNNTDDPEVSSVWESRGGWYNDNGVAVPHCRHQWYQKVIREIL